MLHLKNNKNPPKNTCRYHYQNLDDIIYCSWDTEQNKLKLVILGHFLPFIPLKPPKFKTLKNEKICWRYHHFIHVHQKSQLYDVQFLRYKQNFFVLLGYFFALLPPPLLLVPNIKILKKKKKKKWKKWLEILSFYTYMCAINEDHMIYDSWNIRCDSEIFAIWSHFLPFLPLTTWKIKISTLKKTSGDLSYHFTYLHHKWQSYDAWFLR